ncbi:MAG: hypothetical protein IJJ50_09795 [Lachnospiraceae bacterium]|nr:hypothetical protein [Lachnospiraceae bacterium]
MAEKKAPGTGEIVMKEPSVRAAALMAGGVIVFLAGLAAVWFLTPSFFNAQTVEGRWWKAIVFILGMAAVMLGWNLFADGSEVITATPRKITIARKLRGDAVLPIDHVRKVRLRRRHNVNPLRGMIGRKALHCYIEAREGSYTTLLDGKEGQEAFIAYCRKHQLLKEGSEQELAWFEGHPDE